MTFCPKNPRTLARLSPRQRLAKRLPREREPRVDRAGRDRERLARLLRAVNVRAQVDLRVDALFLQNLVLVVDAAPLIAGDAAADGEQPCRQRAAPFEARQVAVHREEDLLQGVR